MDFQGSQQKMFEIFLFLPLNYKMVSLQPTTEQYSFVQLKRHIFSHKDYQQFLDVYVVRLNKT